MEASLPNEAKASANSVRRFVVLLKQRRKECRLHPSFSAGGKYFHRVEIMVKGKPAFYTLSDKVHLKKAWEKISKRNRLSKGIDNVTIKTFNNNLEKNLSIISAELRRQSYQFTRLRAHAIAKPGSQKPRLLQIASVRDRVVMKALAMLIEPAFTKFDLPCSHAFIKGRGVHHAIQGVQELANAGNKFYFKADIIEFFAHVDRETLWKMFARQVRHRSLLPLLRQCFNLEIEDLSSYEKEFQDLFIGAGSGIPQGGVLSPMLANFYLYHFDRRMLAQKFNLIRYADDFVVMCDSEQRAREAYVFARQTLGTLGLKIHELEAPDSKSKIGNFGTEHLIFLGVRFEGQETIPSDKVIKRFRAKIVEVLQPASGNSLFKTLQRLTNLINGWGKCYKMMRVLPIYLELDEFIKSSVERYLSYLGIQLTGKNKRKHMKLLGVPSLTAMIEYRKADAAAS
ncbi:MAG TPA: reverse transcriptase domain-containing protein [Candidatus Angelobacter sp.]|nr:reverse transcriptase domain-containing protein [Candidatus Angelobacter sp.]